MLPNFDTQMIKDKEDKTPILSLEFSKEAKMLAVSYGNFNRFFVYIIDKR